MKNIIHNSIDIAIVTLFNPKDDVMDNIRSYLPYVKELLVIDNSETPYDLSTLKKEFKLTAFCHSENCYLKYTVGEWCKLSNKTKYSLKRLYYMSRFYIHPKKRV